MVEVDPSVVATITGTLVEGIITNIAVEDTITTVTCLPSFFVLPSAQNDLCTPDGRDQYRYGSQGRFDQNQGRYGYGYGGGGGTGTGSGSVGENASYYNTGSGQSQYGGGGYQGGSYTGNQSCYDGSGSGSSGYTGPPGGYGNSSGGGASTGGGEGRHKKGGFFDEVKGIWHEIEEVKDSLEGKPKPSQSQGGSGHPSHWF